MEKTIGLNWNQQFLKRIIDVLFSFIGLFIMCIPILFLIVVATFSTNKFGLFSQKRVGKNAKLFPIYKIRTMTGDDEEMTIAALNRSRITSIGKFLRESNLDELPQLFNVFIGNMSLVGPRPDVPGYADKLVGDDRIILSVRPGITGPATLKYNNEEELLLNQKKPKEYNDNIIWKEKVKINKQYIKNWSLLYDIQCIIKTILNQ